MDIPDKSVLQPEPDHTFRTVLYGLAVAPDMNVPSCASGTFRGKKIDKKWTLLAVLRGYTGLFLVKNTNECDWQDSYLYHRIECDVLIFGIGYAVTSIPHLWSS